MPMASNCPSAAPTNSDGVNTPPTAPEPMLITVATSLASSTPATGTLSGCSCRMVWMVE
ncbi:hypothetical protein D3C87_2084450 [compost metagenome]